MQIPFRLYYPSDVDIIAMKLRHGRKFNRMIRKYITAFVREDTECEPMIIPDNIDSYIRKPDKPIVMTLAFNDEKDADVVKYLNNIRPYARTDIIRTIIRLSYEEFPAWMFHFDEKQEYKNKKKKKISIKKSSKSVHSNSDITTDKIEKEDVKKEETAVQEKPTTESVIDTKPENKVTTEIVSPEVKQTEPLQKNTDTGHSETSSPENNNPSINDDVFGLLSGMMDS